MGPDDLGAALGLGPPDQSENNVCNFEIYPQALGKFLFSIIGMILLCDFFNK
jgi:hypothetical protein